MCRRFSLLPGPAADATALDKRSNRRRAGETTCLPPGKLLLPRADTPPARLPDNLSLPRAAEKTDRQIGLSQPAPECAPVFSRWGAPELVCCPPLISAPSSTDSCQPEFNAEARRRGDRKRPENRHGQILMLIYYLFLTNYIKKRALIRTRWPPCLRARYSKFLVISISSGLRASAPLR
jgi:hypothetical protein